MLKCTWYQQYQISHVCRPTGHELPMQPYHVKWPCDIYYMSWDGGSWLTFYHTHYKVTMSFVFQSAIKAKLVDLGAYVGKWGIFIFIFSKMKRQFFSAHSSIFLYVVLQVQLCRISIHVLWTLNNTWKEFVWLSPQKKQSKKICEHDMQHCG